MTLSWAGKVMLGFGVVLALLAAVLRSGSILVWIDVGLCILLAGVFFLLDLRICKSGRRKPALAIRAQDPDGPNRWLNTALVLSALVTIFSPAVKAGVDVGRTILGNVRIEGRECKAAEMQPSRPS